MHNRFCALHEYVHGRGSVRGKLWRALITATPAAALDPSRPSAPRLSRPTACSIELVPEYAQARQLHANANHPNDAPQRHWDGMMRRLRAAGFDPVCDLSALGDMPERQLVDFHTGQ